MVVMLLLDTETGLLCELQGVEALSFKVDWRCVDDTAVMIGIPDGTLDACAAFLVITGIPDVNIGVCVAFVVAPVFVTSRPRFVHFAKSALVCVTTCATELSVICTVMLLHKSPTQQSMEQLFTNPDELSHEALPLNQQSCLMEQFLITSTYLPISG